MFRTPRTGSPLTGSRLGTSSPWPTRGTTDQRTTWRNSNAAALAGNSKGFNLTKHAEPWLIWPHHRVRTESSARNEAARVLLLVTTKIPPGGMGPDWPKQPESPFSRASETEMKFFSLSKPRFKYVRHKSTELLMQHHFRARSWGWLAKCYSFRCIFKCC